MFVYVFRSIIAWFNEIIQRATDDGVMLEKYLNTKMKLNQTTDMKDSLALLAWEMYEHKKNL